MLFVVCGVLSGVCFLLFDVRYAFALFAVSRSLFVVRWLLIVVR